jgi:hypothetical protein
LPAHLFLDAEISRSLHRRQKLGQVTLLRFRQVDPFSLELELLRDQSIDFRQVGRILLQYLGTKLTARHHLATVQVPALDVEALIHFAQPTHPLISQA